VQSVQKELLFITCASWPLGHVVEQVLLAEIRLYPVTQFKQALTVVQLRQGDEQTVHTNVVVLGYVWLGQKVLDTQEPFDSRKREMLLCAQLVQFTTVPEQVEQGGVQFEQIPDPDILAVTDPAGQLFEQVKVVYIR